MKMPNLASLYQAGTVYFSRDGQEASNGPAATTLSARARMSATLASCAAATDWNRKRANSRATVGRVIAGLLGMVSRQAYRAAGCDADPSARRHARCGYARRH